MIDERQTTCNLYLTLSDRAAKGIHQALNPSASSEGLHGGECGWPRRLETDLPSFVDRVALVRAMREVRVQVAFTRLEGFNTDAEGAYQLADQSSGTLSLD